MSVVICSLDGASGVERCLRALRGQTIRAELEVIVVDDGSVDDTSEVARIGGADVVRHEVNLGVSAARNSGIRRASGTFVAFLDDDCEPDPDWAENLLSAYDSDEVIGVGGALPATAGRGVILGYLSRHNPLEPREIELTRSGTIPYRFWLYVQRQWALAPRSGRREVAALAAANLSVRRDVLLGVGGFDERFRFGSEDEDLCHRLRLTFPGARLIFEPTARVRHHFKPTLRDVMRRRRLYGRGSAQLHLRWPDVPPTFFPWPTLIIALACLSVRFPAIIAAAVALPQILYPQGLRKVISEGRRVYLLDPYLQLIEEASDNIGFIEGLWRFRSFARPPDVRVESIERPTSVSQR